MALIKNLSDFMIHVVCMMLKDEFLHFQMLPIKHYNSRVIFGVSKSIKLILDFKGSHKIEEKVPVKVFSFFSTCTFSEGIPKRMWNFIKSALIFLIGLPVMVSKKIDKFSLS